MKQFTKENPADIVVLWWWIVWSSVQTLHEWDIESNYSEEKVVKVFNDAQPLKYFVEEEAKKWNIIHRVYPKMLLWVGEEDANTVRKRYERYTTQLWIFPNNKLLWKDELTTLEPELMRWRDKNQDIAAYYNEEWYAIDFWKAAQALIKNGLEHWGENAEAIFGKSLVDIERANSTWDLFKVLLDDWTEIFTKAINMSMWWFTEKWLKKLWYNKDTWIVSMEWEHILILNEMIRIK